MARCEDCIQEKVCLHRINIQTETYAYMGIKYDTEKCEHYMTKDVVPKSEVEKLENAFSRAIRKADQKAIVAIQNSKQEVAREIFEEIENRAFGFGACFVEMTRTTFDEIKKKYTENSQS